MHRLPALLAHELSDHGRKRRVILHDQAREQPSIVSVRTDFP
jgi:hypothetical protein